MRDTHNWRIEKMGQGMFDKDYKNDAVYALEEIRKDLNDHIAAAPEEVSQTYRDELTEVDYAISDALALLEKREYTTGINTEQDRYALYITHFISSRIRELILEAE